MVSRFVKIASLSLATGLLMAPAALAGNGIVSAPMVHNSYSGGAYSGENVSYQFKRGVHHFEAGNYDAARKSFKRMLRYNPTFVHTKMDSRFAMARYYLGVTEQTMGNHDKAMEHLN